MLVTVEIISWITPYFVTPLADFNPNTLGIPACASVLAPAMVCRRVSMDLELLRKLEMYQQGSATFLRVFSASLI